MRLAFWILISRMVIIMAVMAVLYLGITILNKSVRPKTGAKEER
jgi:hypothetical protein